MYRDGGASKLESDVGLDENYEGLEKKGSGKSRKKLINI